MATIHSFSPSHLHRPLFPRTPFPPVFLKPLKFSPPIPNLDFRPLASVKLYPFLSGSFGEGEEEEEEEQQQQQPQPPQRVSDGFFEAIEEMERAAREPAEVLEGMNSQLTVRELQLVMVYFAQEGRDSWYALEVYEWLRRENRVDGETRELMVGIMCGWVEKMVREERGVAEVVALLKDMECVGLQPRFSMVEKVVAVYWGMGRRDEAVAFVGDVLERSVDFTVDGGETEASRGGPVGYLAWKMVADGDYYGAAKLVIEFKEKGLKLEVYSYLIAMTALVKEFNEFSKAVRKVKGLMSSGLAARFDEEDLNLIDNYQSGLLKDGMRLSDWAIQEGGSTILGLVHERLLAMYTCAGQGLEAEQQLWHMKLAGKEPDRDLYDIVLAICASQREVGSVQRLLSRMEAMNVVPGKKTLLWLLRGYIKGGYFEDASETLIKMLDLGLHPEYIDCVAVMQGLRKDIEQSRNVEPFLKLCKHLADEDLIGPCVVYLYMDDYKLWILKML